MKTETLFRCYPLPYGVRKPELANAKEPVSFLDLGSDGLFHAIRIDRSKAFLVEFSLRHEDRGTIHGVEIQWNNGAFTVYAWNAGTGACFRWKTGEYDLLQTQEPTQEPSAS